MNTGQGYGWASLSQWDFPPADAHVEYKAIETALSKGTCRFMLVTRIDQGEGVLRCEYVKKHTVTPEILESAGEIQRGIE
jgi:hypothetical protein